MQELEEKIKQKREKRKNRNAFRSRKRLHDKTVNQAQQVSTDLVFDSLSISSTGWMGKRFDIHQNAQMKRKWANRTIESEMVDFQKVAFEEKYVPHFLVDLFGYANRYQFEVTVRNGHKRL